MPGRPPKEGLDFAGWDTGIFDNDPKILKLLGSQGCYGFITYFYLCQKAYGSNGYFYPWCYDDASITARKIGGGISVKSVEEAVRYCLQISLFDKELFDEWNILTSRGIQKRFRMVAKERTGNKVIQEYWLLEESAGLNFYTLNSNFPPTKLNYTPSELNYQPLKESKVNNIINMGDDPNAPALAHVKKHYENHMGNHLSPTAYTELAEFIESGIEPALICRAIDISIDANKRNWPYARAILNNCQRTGIQTLEQYEAHETNRKKTNKNTNDKKPPRQNRFCNFPQRSDKDPDYLKNIEKLERAYRDQKYSIHS